MPWFKRWSSGRFAVGLWSFFSFSMVLFYTCNLRAYLAIVNYEEPLYTLESIAENGQRVFKYSSAYLQRCDVKQKFTSINKAMIGSFCLVY